MRFACQNPKCMEVFDESLVTSSNLKGYKQGKLPIIAVTCPFCGCGTLKDVS